MNNLKCWWYTMYLHCATFLLKTRLFHFQTLWSCIQSTRPPATITNCACKIPPANVYIIFHHYEDSSSRRRSVHFKSLLGLWWCTEAGFVVGKCITFQISWKWKPIHSSIQLMMSRDLIISAALKLNLFVIHLINLSYSRHICYCSLKVI